MNVVVRDGENAVSLLVDRIGDVLEVDEDLFESPPRPSARAFESLIVGAYKLSDRLLLVLDTGRALAESDSRATAETRLAR